MAGGHNLPRYSAPPSRSAHLLAFHKRAVKKARTRRQRKVARYYRKRRQDFFDFFKYLPPEIIFNILSRLSVPTTMRCKCVSKSWLNLLETPEFQRFRVSKSTVTGLAIFYSGLKRLKVVESVDEADSNCCEHRWNTVFKLELPFREPPCTSVNGLIFLHRGGYNPGNLFLCNPITRDYIVLPSAPQPFSTLLSQKEIYGYGVSRVSGQYKVVRIFLDINLQIPPPFKCARLVCQVYVIGTGSWRKIASGSPLMYVENRVGAFLNGNLHWLASRGSSLQISCLDLETELFTTFSAPPLLPPFEDPNTYRHLSVLGDCLCVCDNSANEADIWLMKQYGDEKSWTKQFIISNVDMDYFEGIQGNVFPIEAFKDGDILMQWRSGGMFHNTSKLFYYSKTKTIEEAGAEFGLDDYSYWHSADAMMYAPSFRPLKRFALENVRSF